MNDQIFDIPKQLRVKILYKGIFAFWHFGLLIGYATLIMYTQDYIPLVWRVPTYVSGAIFIFFWILPSGQNPGKLKIQTLYFLLIRDRTVYHPISLKRKIDDLSLDQFKQGRR
ncbi:MAG: hypothetical protein K0Q87_156 [Neobacillus sp.]|nr:hypothetical protein [Neobacillus sp.]